MSVLKDMLVRVAVDAGSEAGRVWLPADAGSSRERVDDEERGGPAEGTHDGGHLLPGAAAEQQDPGEARGPRPHSQRAAYHTH